MGNVCEGVNLITPFPHFRDAYSVVVFEPRRQCECVYFHWKCSTVPYARYTGRPDGGGVNCVQTPGVTLSCIDAHGLKFLCEATITVRRDAPSAITCPSVSSLEVRERRERMVSFALVASDACSIVTTAACVPASGGAPRRVAALRSSSKTRGPPAIACPAPMTAECTGSGGAVVALEAAPVWTAGRIRGQIDGYCSNGDGIEGGRTAVELPSILNNCEGL